MSLCSRAYKILCFRYRNLLQQQRQGRGRPRTIGCATRSCTSLEPLEPRVLLSGVSTPWVPNAGQEPTADLVVEAGDDLGQGPAIAMNSTVVDRHVFYNNSAFDTVSDDGAIAPSPQNANDSLLGKTALLPDQTASFINYTSFSKGINGIMIDMADRPDTTLTRGDFEFRVGNDNDPFNWDDAPAPISPITVRDLPGDENVDRVTIIWADEAIRGQWLQVVIKASDNTGLLEDDVFYFGNAMGETGNGFGDTADSAVNLFDLIGTRDNQTTTGETADIENRFDFNRDQQVNVSDMIALRNHATTTINDSALRLITVPDFQVSVTAELTHDTAPNGTTNTDGITSDPTVAGRVAYHDLAAEVSLGLDGTFVPIIDELALNGAFDFDRDDLEAKFGVLTDGPHTLRMIALDDVGGVIVLAEVSLTLDTTAPTVESGPLGTFDQTTSFLEVVFSEVVESPAFDVARYSLMVDGGPNDGQVIAIESVSSFEDAKIARLNLSGELINQNYQLIITGDLVDMAGNTELIADDTFDFTVAEPVTITQASPIDGSLQGSVKFRTIRVDFSQPMNASTVTGGNVRLVRVSDPNTPIVPTNTEVINGGRTFLLTYDALVEDVYELQVDTTTMTDISGNAVVTPSIANRFTVIPGTVAGDYSGLITEDTVWADTSAPYRIVGDLTIVDGVTLSIAEGVQVDVLAEHRVIVDGALVVDGAERFRFTRNQSRTTGMVVNGLLTASNTMFSELVNSTFQSSTFITVNAGGRMIASDTGFLITTVTLDHGSMLSAGNLTENQFITNLRVPGSFVPFLETNRQFTTVSVLGGTIVEDVTWNPLGTDTTVGMRYLIEGSLTIDDDATLTITAGTSVDVAGNQTVTINGSLELNGLERFRFTRNQSRTTGMVVNGLLTASNTMFSELVNSTFQSSTFITVNAGGRMIASDTGFLITTVTLDHGSMLSAGNLTENQFITNLRVPGSFVPFLETNRQFTTVSVLGGTIVEDVTWNPLGTDTTVGMRYLIEGSLTIDDDATLTITAGTSVDVAGNQTVTINGSLELNGLERFRFIRDQSRTTSMVVNGSLTASDTLFSELVNSTFQSSTFIAVNASGQLSLMGNEFEVPVRVPGSFVPLLETNRRFTTVLIPGGTIVDDVTWNPLGTDTTVDMRYLIEGSLTIGDDATLTITAGTSVDVEGSQTVTIDGALVVDGAERFRFTRNQSRTTGMVVNGLLTASNTMFSELVNSTFQSSTFITVNAGGRMIASDTGFLITTVTLDHGSMLSAGNLTENQFITNLRVPGSFVPFLETNRQFTTVSVLGGTIVEDVTWNPLGTDTTVGMRYLIEGSLTIDDDATLTITAGTSVDVAGNQTVTINGSLELNGLERFRFIRDQSRTTSMVVNGSLTASDTLFSELVNSTFQSSTFIAVNASGQLSLMGNEFEVPVRVPGSFVPLLETNRRFTTVLIPGGTIVDDVTWNPLGTDTTVDMRYLIEGSLTIGDDATLTITAGTSVDVEGSQTVTINGALVVDGAERFRFTRNQSRTTGMVVNGLLTASNTMFSELVNSTFQSSTFISANPGSTISATDTTFGVQEVRLSDGSTLGTLTGNVFTSRLTTSVSNVPLLTNNLSFGQVDILGGTLSQDMIWTPLGTSTTAGMRYRVVGEFTVESGSTLTVAPNTDLDIFATLRINEGASMVIQQGARVDINDDEPTLGIAFSQFQMIVDGSLTVDGAERVRIFQDADENPKIVVNGTLTATNTVLTENSSHSSRGSTLVEVNLGGTISATDTTFGVQEVRLSDGSTLGTLTGNVFTSRLTTSVSNVPLLTNNLSFGQVDILGGTLSQDMIWTPLGTSTTAGMRYRVVGEFTVESGSTLTVAPNTDLDIFATLRINEGASMVIQQGARVDINDDEPTLGIAFSQFQMIVDGSLTVDGAERVRIFQDADENPKIVVNGTLTATNTVLTENSSHSSRGSTLVEVNLGGTISATDTTFGVQEVRLSDGSTLGTLTGNVFTSRLTTSVSNVPLLTNNLSFGQVDILGGTLSQDMIWTPLGTSTTAGMRYRVVGEFTVESGSTLTVAPNTDLDIFATLRINEGASMVIQQGARVDINDDEPTLGIAFSQFQMIVDGSLTVDGAERVRIFQDADENPKIVVNGTLTATNTVLTENSSHSSRGSTLVEVNLGGTISATDTTFGVQEVRLSDGSTLGTLTGNVFTSRLTTSVSNVPLLTNNLSFGQVDILGGTLSQDMIWTPLGTSTTAGMRYRVVGEFTVESGSTLTVAPNTDLDIFATLRINEGASMVIQQGARVDINDDEPTLGIAFSQFQMIVDGSLTVDGAERVRIFQDADENPKIVVNGTLTATNTVLTENSSHSSRGSTLVEVNLGGTISATDTTFGVQEVRLSDGSTLGTLTGNVFTSRLTTSVSNVPLLTNNLSFGQVDILGGTLSQDMIWTPLGTSTTAGMRYRVVGEFTVESGSTLTVAPNTDLDIFATLRINEGASMVIQQGARVDINDDEPTLGIAFSQFQMIVDGSLTVDGAERVRIFQDADENPKIVVNGTLTATNTVLTENSSHSSRGSTLVEVNLGGTLIASRSLLATERLSLADAAIGSVSLTTFSTNLQLSSGVNVQMRFNDFTSGSVTAIGDSTATIDLRENWWGTTNANVIENKITHQSEDANLPVVDFGDFLLAPPIVPDLVAETLNIVSGTPLTPGGTLTLEYEVSNASPGADIDSTAAVFFLSEDGTLNDPLFIGVTALPSLAPSTSTGLLSLSITLPDVTNPWWTGRDLESLTLSMAVDALNQVIEFNESNNLIGASVPAV